MSERAMQKLQGRKTKVASYYFDMNLVGDYWCAFLCIEYYTDACAPHASAQAADRLSVLHI